MLRDNTQMGLFAGGPDGGGMGNARNIDPRWGKLFDKMIAGWLGILEEWDCLRAFEAMIERGDRPPTKAEAFDLLPDHAKAAVQSSKM